MGQVGSGTTKLIGSPGPQWDGRVVLSQQTGSGQAGAGRPEGRGAEVGSPAPRDCGGRGGACPRPGGWGQDLPLAKTTWRWPDSREAWARGRGLPRPGREAPPRVCAYSSARPVCGVSRPVDPLVLLSWSRVRMLSPLWAAVRARQGTVSVWKPRLRRGLVQCVAVL